MRRNQRKQEGFTLMELMVVIVIVAILAAVAVPLYINYVKDAQRTEAKGAIGAVITAEQVYRQSHPDLGYTLTVADLNVDLTDISGKWNITIPSADPNGFVIEARQAGTQQNPLKVTYTYTRNGQSEWRDE